MVLWLSATLAAGFMFLSAYSDLCTYMDGTRKLQDVKQLYWIHLDKGRNIVFVLKKGQCLVYGNNYIRVSKKD